MNILSKLAIVCGVTALCLLSTRVEAGETVNQKILQFCQDNIGKQVGDGQCASLATAALKAAGAKPWTGTEDPNPGDYKWGTFVCMRGMKDGQGSAASSGSRGPQAGDVMQLRDAKLEGTTPDGGTYSMGPSTRHTLIIKTVTRAEGQDYTFEVYESNFNGRMTVAVNTYIMNDLKSGFYRVYMPDPK